MRRHRRGNKEHKVSQLRPLSVESLERREMLASSAAVFAGDFDGDGIDTIGFYDPGPGDFFFSNSNVPGIAEQRVHFGPTNSSFLPIVGDFDGDGTDTLGLYDPFAARFYLKNTNAPGLSDEVFRFGPLNLDWLPIAADFDGDGRDGVALYDRSTARFYVNESFVDYSLDAVY